MEVIFKKAAENDVSEAIDWYRSKRIDLGQKYLFYLEQKILEIKENPLAFPIVYKNIHRALISKFPYAIFYINQNGRTYVLAVQHMSRNPQIWKVRK